MAKTTKATAKYALNMGGKTRYALSNLDIARRTAKAKTTVMKRESFRTQRRLEDSYGKGGSLHEGMISMAMMVQPSDEIRDKIEAMDPDKLAAMYAGNNTLFEVFFNYESINYVSGYGYVVDESKQEDLELFVNQYERLFGRIE